VIRPKVYMSSHWDGLFPSVSWPGMPFQLKEDALKGYLEAEVKIAFMPPQAVISTATGSMREAVMAKPNQRRQKRIKICAISRKVQRLQQTR